MLATLIAASFIAESFSPADFFPLVPGSRRTYEEKLDRVTLNTDEVGIPETVKTITAIPVVTTEGGKAISKTYYQVDSSGVWIVATNVDHPLPKPIPILQISGEKTKWSYEGPTDDSKQAEAIAMEAESRILPDREILGKKVAILEVKLTTAVGGGLAQEKSEQTALYGKGIGLVQLVSKTKVGKKTVTNELKLVKIEEAKSGG